MSSSLCWSPRGLGGGFFLHPFIQQKRQSFWEGGQELLAVLVQSGSRLAEQELMSRYYPSVKASIRSLARKMKLPREELADAQEQAMLWFDEAIQRFQIRTQPRQRFRSFRTTVNWLLGKRFLNLIKRQRWTRRHFDQSGKAVRELGKATASLTGSKLSIDSQEQEESGAALSFVDEEFRARLEWAVKQLRPQHQDLWACLKAGRKLKWIAKDLGVSERTIRRWKAELRDELQRMLGEQSK